ncbi:hypothetical protein JW758_04155 [Candidatus Peregrinibacteria bacterium]|nr:hypothetical protein [Candidatus Peregrinibacteria bacterium]
MKKCNNKTGGGAMFTKLSTAVFLAAMFFAFSNSASAAYCDRYEGGEADKCGSGMSQAKALPGYGAMTSATAKAPCEAARANALDQCTMKAGGSDAFIGGCKKTVKAYKCPDGGPVTVSAVCGNGKCEKGETKKNCPKDCGSTPPPVVRKGKKCGNGVCDASEDFATCPEDCHCGDGTCDPTIDETFCTCADDCKDCPEGCEGAEPPPCSDCMEEALKKFWEEHVQCQDSTSTYHTVLKTMGCEGFFKANKLTFYSPPKVDMEAIAKASAGNGSIPRWFVIFVTVALSLSFLCLLILVFRKKKNPNTTGGSNR